MSQYLVEQFAARANIDVLYGAEVVAAHGETSLQAIDVRERATGETRRLDSGGLFIFIGADAETGWLPPEIALDDHGYVLTGSAVAAAGSWPLERDPYLLEIERAGDLRVRRRPVRAREARGRRRRGGQHGHRVRAPVPQGGRTHSASALAGTHAPRAR